MTYNSQGKRTSLENLAGQVTTTAWDGWYVTYNGENRPVLWLCVSTNSPTPNSSTPNSSTPPLISMSFDRQGRRVTKIGIGPFAAGFGWDGIFPDSREVATLREEFTKTCCCGVK